MTAGPTEKWFSIKTDSKLQTASPRAEIDRATERPSTRALGQSMYKVVLLLLLLGSANWCVIFP